MERITNVQAISKSFISIHYFPWQNRLLEISNENCRLNRSGDEATSLEDSQEDSFIIIANHPLLPPPATLHLPIYKEKQEWKQPLQ